MKVYTSPKYSKISYVTPVIERGTNVIVSVIEIGTGGYMEHMPLPLFIISLILGSLRLTELWGGTGNFPIGGDF